MIGFTFEKDRLSETTEQMIIAQAKNACAIPTSSRWWDFNPPAGEWTAVLVGDLVVVAVPFDVDPHVLDLQVLTAVDQAAGRGNSRLMAFHFAHKLNEAQKAPSLRCHRLAWHVFA